MVLVRQGLEGGDLVDHEIQKITDQPATNFFGGWVKKLGYHGWKFPLKSGKFIWCLMGNFEVGEL